MSILSLIQQAGILMKNTEHEISIERLSFEGVGIGKIDGVTVFVQNTLPGDKAKIVITKKKKNHFEGKLLEIISPSPDRIKPRCQYFGLCGGCKYQSLDYQAQLKFKMDNIKHAFRIIKDIPETVYSQIIPSDDIYFYRNKMDFSFSDRIWKIEPPDKDQPREKELGLGLHIPKNFFSVLDIKECFLQSELGNNVINSVRDFCKSKNLDAFSTKTHEGFLKGLVIKDSKATGELLVNIVTYYRDEKIVEEMKDFVLSKVPQITTFVNNVNSSKSQTSYGEDEYIHHGNGKIIEKLNELKFEVSANSFFQTNTKQTKKMYELIKNIANTSSDDLVYDLYSGVGSISLYLADKVKKIVGIELINTAVDNANENAKFNQIDNVTFYENDMKNLKNSGIIEREGKPDVVITDPPRAGMHPKALKTLKELRPEKIVYVGCNPPIQAQNVAELLDDYEIKHIQPVDMFPHTAHIENVVLLEKRK